MDSRTKRSGNTATCITILRIFALFIVSSHVMASKSDVDPNELLLVQVVHRHGERTALFEIPQAGKAYAPYSRPQEAQLTTEGVRQMYQYGRFMRKRYSAFFDNGTQTVGSRVRVISSATDRTISSAQAMVAGLLPPNGTQRQWNTSLGEHWNPFPVYTRPREHDSLLLSYARDCPTFTELRKNIGLLPVAQELQQELKEFVEQVKLAMGIDKYDFFETSVWLEDALHYKHNYPEQGRWPDWVNQSMVDTFRRIADLRMHMLVGGNRDRVRTKFRVGNLVRELFEKMDNSRSDGSTKLYLYSGHDENVAALLAAFDMYNYTLTGPNLGVPHFTASFIMEYFRDNTVRLLFKNDLTNRDAEPEVLWHPQCSEFCPFDKLLSLVEDVVITESQWRIDCGLQIPTVTDPITNSAGIGLSDSIIIAGVLIAFALILLAAALAGVYRWRHRASFSSPEYTRPLTFTRAYPETDHSLAIPCDLQAAIEKRHSKVLP